MPPTAKHGRERKWDWELAFALYAGGMNAQMIKDQPAFKGVALSAIYNRVKGERWNEKRMLLENEAQATLNRTLAGRLAEAQASHESWVNNEVEKERIVLQSCEKKPGDLKDQSMRLGNLEKIDLIARRTLRLDEQKPMDPTALIFATLVHMQDNVPPRIKKAASGILGLKNGISEEDQTMEMEVVRVDGGKKTAYEIALEKAGIEGAGKLDPDYVPMSFTARKEMEAGMVREIEVDEAEEPPTPGLAQLPKLRL